MAEMCKIKNHERVFFKSGEQQKFFTRVKQGTGLPWASLAKKLGITKRTLFDWRREKYSLNLCSLKEVCTLAKIPLPGGIEIRSQYWSNKNAAKLGGLAMYKKYGAIGDPLVRQKRWQEWWDTKGKYNPNQYFIARKIYEPRKSTKLAEFIGIMIGDGGITDRQITITLNTVVDKDYIKFVSGLLIGLFKVKPSILPQKKSLATRVAVSSTNLVNFCQSLGLKVGNKLKQHLDIPPWVRENPEYEKACLRGLIDTDGCLFMECHKLNGKTYCYPRLSLVSASIDLRDSVNVILNNLGFSPRIRGNRAVQLEDIIDINKYFAKIGSSHPKNREKYRLYLEGSDNGYSTGLENRRP